MAVFPGGGARLRQPGANCLIALISKGFLPKPVTAAVTPYRDSTGSVQDFGDTP